MKIFLSFSCCFVLAIYGSEDLFVFKLNPALNEGHTAEDNLKILPANGSKTFHLFTCFYHVSACHKMVVQPKQHKTYIENRMTII